jgi:predicted RNase H-like nuclease
VRFDAVATGASAVAEFVLAHRERTTVVAIDAPLIVQNRRGRRPCETELTRRFRKAHAGTHASNLELYPNPAGVALARALAARGFRHVTPPDRPWSADGRWLCEVYPHPAQVVLFGRDRIIRYKRGSVAERRAGLAELRREIAARLLPALPGFEADAALREFLSRDLARLRGAARKRYEDSLDALVCAYLAYHLWRFGWERSELFGDLETGYIAVPTTPA